MATPRSAPYRGPAGAEESYYVAVLDVHHPIERLSGRHADRNHALEILRWVRRRDPRARLVRELRYLVIED